MTVADDPAGVEGQLTAGSLCCPDCQGRLAGWGWARPRVIRGEAGARWLVRPRRARCSGCAATHVLLPVTVVLLLLALIVIAIVAAIKTSADA